MNEGQDEVKAFLQIQEDLKALGDSKKRHEETDDRVEKKYV